jgi:hypothetical protein
MVDSADRNELIYPSPFKFQINKPNQLLTGFFNRIGTTEVVLEWCEPNLNDDTLVVDVSGATVRSNATVTIITSFMTIEDCLNDIASQLTPTNGVTFSVFAGLNGTSGIDASGGKFRILASSLQRKLDFDISGALATRKLIGQCPDLRRFRYIDLVSPQLTQVQDVKDSSTAPLVRDVLCRWYMDEDVPEPRDGLGYPILMGYEPFRRRRLYNPPKQIHWDPKLNVGNVAFEVYDDNGNLVENISDDSEFLFTLQLSEN